MCVRKSEWRRGGGVRERERVSGGGGEKQTDREEKEGRETEKETHR